MQRLRGDIGPVGPDDRAELSIKRDAGKVCGVLERGKDPAPRIARETQFALNTIVKLQMQAVRPTRLNSNDVSYLTHDVDARATDRSLPAVLLRGRAPSLPLAHSGANAPIRGQSPGRGEEETHPVPPKSQWKSRRRAPRTER